MVDVEAAEARDQLIIHLFIYLFAIEPARLLKRKGEKIKKKSLKGVEVCLKMSLWVSLEALQVPSLRVDAVCRHALFLFFTVSLKLNTVYSNIIGLKWFLIHNQSNLNGATRERVTACVLLKS